MLTGQGMLTLVGEWSNTSQRNMELKTFLMVCMSSKRLLQNRAWY